MSNKRQVNPLRIGIVVLIGTVLFFAGALVRHHFDPLVFVQFAIPNVNDGYDGQYAYYIALEGQNAIPNLDVPPAWRYQRILYPMLSAILGLGQPGLIPWTMIAINILSHAAAAGLFAHLLATRTQVSPWWAIVPAMWAGAIISIRLDLNEPLAIVISLAAVAVYFQNRLILAGIIFGLAGLGKDLGLVLAGGLILYELSQRHLKRGFLLAILSVGPYMIWALFLRLWLGQAPDHPGPSRFPLVIPFVNLSYAQDTVRLFAEILWAILPAIIIIIIILRYFRRYRDKPELWMAVSAAIFTIYFPLLRLLRYLAHFALSSP